MESDFVIRKDMFLRVRSEPFEQIYQVHPKPIGSGSFAQVLKVKQRQRPKEGWQAAKAYSKKRQGSHQQMLNELRILRRLDHPAIIKIHEVFEDATSIYLVQDFCEGGELFGRLHSQGGLSEFGIFRQLLEGVAYCHSHNVAHRDLKPENVLFLAKDTLDVKLVDFGLAFEWERNMREELLLRSAKNVVGTVYYISPDIFIDNNHYDQRTDLWSLGVILYVLITGTAPFDGETEQDVLDAIANYNYTLNDKSSHTHPQLKDLIKRMLVPAEQRLSTAQIFAHSWMTSQPNRTPIRINTATLKTFSKFSKTKRLAANLLACRASPAEVEQLTRLFQQMDVNRDGELSFEELKRGLEREGMKQAEIRAFMDHMDSDHNGKVNYTEFLAGFAGEGQLTQEGIRRAFELLDSDGNGVVEKQELLALFQQSGMESFKGRTAEAILEECDRDGNGVIDFQEFRACLRGKP